MHIVRIMGGLGNQLFEYALYIKFKTMGYEAYVDTNGYRNGEEFRSCQLEAIGATFEEAPESGKRKLFCNTNSRLSMAIAKRLHKKTHFRQRELFFDESILNQKEGYFDGYWQSEKYFAGSEDEIRDAIELKEELSQQNQAYLSRMSSDVDSVSVHIRLGDYLDNDSMYGGICTEDYYEKAISYILENVSKPSFYVFSNDIEKAKNIFSLLGVADATFVEGNSEDKGYIDLFLMSACRHHIIANSSFSWWGAWLGKAEDKIVVAPSTWVKGIRSDDVCPDSWVRI